jgi:hypothetical protein
VKRLSSAFARSDAAPIERAPDAIDEKIRDIVQ